MRGDQINCVARAGAVYMQMTSGCVNIRGMLESVLSLSLTGRIKVRQR